MSRVLQRFVDKENNLVGYNAKCPGCDMWHSIYTVVNQYNKAVWFFDENMEKPTFAPSLLVTWNHGEAYKPRRCHSFIRNGVWEFLSDCTHKLAGQKVPMIDLDKSNE